MITHINHSCLKNNKNCKLRNKAEELLKKTLIKSSSIAIIKVQSFVLAIFKNLYLQAN